MNFNEHIQRELLNEYAGSEKKRTVILDDGYKYLLKFPDPVRESRNEISYINNAISEYIGCKIVKSLGLPVQEVILGEYTDERGKTKIACACRDVRNPGEIMHPVQTLNLSSLDSLATNEASLKNAMDFAEHLHLIPAETVKTFYYDMFVADALLGNTDRHNGNWAIITDEEGNARMSPIYDCGSSLSPLLGEADLDHRHLSNSAMNTFSVILDEHHKRLNYKDYFLSCKNPELNAAAKRVIGRIDLREINSIIDQIPYISEKRKNFYKDLLLMRYEKIMVPTLQKLFYRAPETVEERTKTITTAELKSYSSDVMDMIRNADQYQLYEMPFQDAERTVVFRKVNNKIAILYDPECNVTGVAPIGKDYQEVKAFICEVDQAIQMQYSCEMKITESAIYESDENQHLDSNALDLSTEEMER